MKPSSIRFTEDSIHDRFSNDVPLENTFVKLLYGSVQVIRLRKIEVVNDEGVWWAIEGNRLLFLFKWLEEVKALKEVEVIVRDLKNPKFNAVYREKKTTTSDGKSIVCGRGQLENKLTEIINEYQKFTMLMKQFLVENLNSDDYMEHYELPDFLPGSCQRKYREDI